MPSTSLWPSLMPVASMTTALMTLPDLYRQRVGRDECEWSGLGQRAVAELFDVVVEVGGHAADLGLPVDARVLTSLSIRRVDTPAG